MWHARSEESPTYGPREVQFKDDAHLIRRALEVLRQRYQAGVTINSPDQLRELMVLQYGPEERELFSVVFLNTQHTILAHETMFAGTLTQTSVFPREVVKRALQLNAGAVILVHNHPSGSPEPSRADEHITQELKSALALVDVRVLDHMVVSGTGAVSLVERGLV